MPRFESYNPASITTAIEVFPKDQYEFVVGEPKPFAGTNQKGGDSYGVRFSLKVGAGEYEGKKTIYSTYLQSEGAQAMAKQFQMAVLGYGKGRAEEQRFNEDWGGKDWSIDFEAGTVGDAWRELVGNRVKGNLDVGVNTNSGDAQQQFKGWEPFGK